MRYFIRRYRIFAQPASLSRLAFLKNPCKVICRAFRRTRWTFFHASSLLVFLGFITCPFDFFAYLLRWWIKGKACKLVYCPFGAVHRPNDRVHGVCVPGDPPSSAPKCEQVINQVRWGIVGLSYYFDRAWASALLTMDTKMVNAPCLALLCLFWTSPFTCAVPFFGWNQKHETAVRLSDAFCKPSVLSLIGKLVSWNQLQLEFELSKSFRLYNFKRNFRASHILQMSRNQYVLK